MARVYRNILWNGSTYGQSDIAAYHDILWNGSTYGKGDIAVYHDIHSTVSRLWQSSGLCTWSVRVHGNKNFDQS